MPRPGVQGPLFSAVVPPPTTSSSITCPRRSHTPGFLLISPRLPVPPPVSLVCAGPSLLHIISFCLHNHHVKGMIPAFQVKKMRSDVLRCTVRRWQAQE